MIRTLFAFILFILILVPLAEARAKYNFNSDWRLFVTLIRFDAVYHGHFKCNLRRLADYTNLWGFTRELYQWPGVAATVLPPSLPPQAGRPMAATQENSTSRC